MVLKHRRTKREIEGDLNEIYYRLVPGQKDKDIMRATLLKERNYYKYKQKLSKRLENVQKEKTENSIWLEVQTLKDRMSNIYCVLEERIKNARTETKELPGLAMSAESVAINILRLESASLTAVKRTNNLEKKVLNNISTKHNELPILIESSNSDSQISTNEINNGISATKFID